MKKTSLVFIIFGMFVGSVFAQQTKDSYIQKIQKIKNEINSTKQDTTRLRLMNDLSSMYFENYENDSCRKYAEQVFHQVDNIFEKNKISKDNYRYKTLKARATQYLGWTLIYKNVNHAQDTLQLSLKLWQKSGNKNGIASVNGAIAEAYSMQHDHTQALQYLYKSLELYNETNNQELIAYTWFKMGLLERYMGNYGDALESNLKALQVARKIKDTATITDALLANGFNYMLVKKYPEALVNQEEALKLFKLQKDSIGIATTYNDMGVSDMRAGKLEEALSNHRAALAIRKNLKDATYLSISYNYIADILMAMDKLEAALENSVEGIKYGKIDGDLRFINDAYLTSGEIQLKLKDYTNAQKSYEFVLQLGRENNNPHYQAIALTGIAKVNRLKGNYNETIALLDKAEAIVAKEDHKTRRTIYGEMSATFAKKNDYKNAFESQLNYQKTNDSVNASEKIMKITSLTQQLAFENKIALQKASQDKQLLIQQTQLKKQKLIRNLSIAGLLLVIIFALILYYRIREKRRLNQALGKSLTELQETQKQLIHSEKMASLGELTAGIAHEIQNPLNFVNNFSEVSNELIDEMNEEIEKGDMDEAKIIANDIKQNLEKITHHGKRADAIVKGMLQHSRKSSPEKEPTDINRLADEYLRLAYHGLRAKDKSFNATLETDFDESIGKVNVIPQDLGRVILNLITNAFYATSEKQKTCQAEDVEALPNYKPTVSVSTKKMKDEVVINVKDNGNGIPKEVLDKIFQPFFTTKPSGSGTGLGLSLSYDIVKAHGGNIEVESKENVGTSFRILLPIAIKQ
ncbi:tetratricopeptide repeat protein [Ulvibacter antarcticus]|uniref:histidine kinase n=1 Tax=Ulvibacter antarcticus TaxID=442714 RepID=A0A3L9YE13_9FLAO|nr:tetratricopeptide repeat protein [Ulvibacter antarcticus]RMA57299.1 tetratricopeptide repeat protein [Ulvibacter antarcticus]